MKWTPNAITVMAGAALALTPVVSHATVFLTLAQAQQVLFPGQAMQPVKVSLSDADQKALKKASTIYHSMDSAQVFRSADHGWMVVDQVLGKHEMITFAVALTPAGAVRQVEILEYRETYGGQVRSADWRNQFVGKTAASPIKLGQDIRNISGATLSCRHISDGVKRIVTLFELKLKSLA